VNIVRRHWFIIALVIGAAGLRFALLLLARTHVHSDEAVIGLMGRHILEGRYFPFYMYGQAYAASTAWEGYLAVIPFKLFGVGVIPLKSCIVLLSLACLVLFYVMVRNIYGQTTALWSTLVFALSPSLLKWHFEVRGYSFYFLSIVVLAILFWRIASSPATTRKDFILFGLASGLSVCCSELSLPLIAALWILLALRRNLSIQSSIAAVIGFLFGYAPVVIFNLTHQFGNWRTVFGAITGGGSGGKSLPVLFRPSTFQQIFFQELPKFFGPDTTIWYYPQTSIIGFVFYALALLGMATALWPFIKSPVKALQVIRGNLEMDDASKDFLMLILIAACFVPYLMPVFRVPRYFLAGCFFLSLLIGRMLQRCFAAAELSKRLLGAVLLMSILAGGIGAMIEFGKRNEVETIALCENGEAYCMARIPGADLDAVEHHLREFHIGAAWASPPLCYVLRFETCEKIAISDEIFGWKHNVFPRAVAMRSPRADEPLVFIIETNSPLRRSVEERCAGASGAAPLIAEYGMLSVIEQR
jgi:4-amino-4-deoxy-L-arabinose transferase-like glycosyltransferase